MKYFVFTASLILFTFVLHAQDNSPLQQTQEEITSIKANKVKSYVITFYEITGNKKKKTSDVERGEYDENGYLVMEEWGWKEPNDISIETTRYTYNAKYWMIQSITHNYDFDGEEKEIYDDKEVYEYSSSGEFIKSCWYTKDDMNFQLQSCDTYEYKDGKLVLFNDGWKKTQYVYEYSGDTLIKRLPNGGQILRKSVNSRVIYSCYGKTEWNYFYNSKNRLIKSETWEDHILTGITEMEYKNDLLHQVIYKNAKDEITEMEIYTYEYYKN